MTHREVDMRFVDFPSAPVSLFNGESVPVIRVSLEGPSNEPMPRRERSC